VRLPVSEVHVLAGPNITKLEDLRGKKVSFGPAGSASSLTGTIVFQRLGVQVDQVLLDNSTALQQLRSGELSALVRVIGKPIEFFARIPPNSGLHFLSIPFSKVFADYYAVSELTSKEYPGLVSEGHPSRASAAPQMARRKPCRHCAGVDPVERRGGDVASVTRERGRGRAGDEHRILGIPQKQRPCLCQSDPGAARVDLPRFFAVAKAA
jgi:hypothetical protein